VLQTRFGRVSSEAANNGDIKLALTVDKNRSTSSVHKT
jgi:hypothetical protein